MMKQIRLTRTGQGWDAMFDDRGETQAWCGTNTIPTAYTEYARAEVVLEAFVQRYPGYVVSIAGR